ncbi:MAG: hypothetical protein U1F37_09980 [Alphaproteobacteria bacterium]
MPLALRVLLRRRADRDRQSAAERGGLNAPVALPRGQGQSGPRRAARVGRKRPVYFEERGWVPSTVYRREALRHGMRVKGPAVIEEGDVGHASFAGFAAEVGDLGLFIPLRKARRARR